MAVNPSTADSFQNIGQEQFPGEQELPLREVYFRQKQDISSQEEAGRSFLTHFSLFDAADPTIPILQLDHLMAQEAQIVENERIQKVMLFRRQNQLYTFGRDVRAVSLSVLAYDIREPENLQNGNVARNQAQIIEHAHRQYFRLSKLTEQQRFLILNFAGFTFRVAATDLGAGEVSATPHVQTVQWRFIVLEDLTRFTPFLNTLNPVDDTTTNRIEEAAELREEANKDASNAQGANIATQISDRKEQGLQDSSNPVVHAASREAFRRALNRSGS